MKIWCFTLKSCAVSNVLYGNCCLLWSGHECIVTKVAWAIERDSFKLLWSLLLRSCDDKQCCPLTVLFSTVLTIVYWNYFKTVFSNNCERQINLRPIYSKGNFWSDDLSFMTLYASSINLLSSIWCKYVTVFSRQLCYEHWRLTFDCLQWCAALCTAEIFTWYYSMCYTLEQFALDCNDVKGLFGSERLKSKQVCA